MSWRGRTVVLLALLVVARLAYIAWGPFEVSPDEAHYWEWSRRLGLSYYSKGPGVAYVIALFTSFLGPTELGIRAGAVLFSTAASYFIYLIGRDIFESEKAGFYAALLANLSPLFSIGAILMTTDVMLIFFWAAAVYCVHLATVKRRSGWWYLAGAAIGLGFLSKYTMVLIYPCLLLYFLASRRDRFWLGRPEPYFAALLSLAAATPVIIWNIVNGQVTIMHAMGQAHVESAGLSFEDFLEFLASQAGLLTPLIFIGLAYGVWMALARGLREKRDELLLAFFASAPLFVFFVAKSFHGKVQANWAVASFVTAFPAAVWAVERLKLRQHPPARRVVRWVTAFALGMGAVGSLIAYFPWAAAPFGLKGLVDGPPYNRVTGWTELGGKVSLIKRQMEAASPAEVFIISDTYQITGELALYMEDNPITYNAHTGSRRMNQYDIWPGPDRHMGADAIYVKGGDEQAEPLIEGAFSGGCGQKDLIEIHWDGRPVKEFSAFRCRGFKGFEPIDIDNY